MAGHFLDKRIDFGAFRIRRTTLKQYAYPQGGYDGPLVIPMDVLGYPTSEYFAAGIQGAHFAAFVG